MTNMTKEAAARIQSAEAKANDGKIAKGSFAARAMAAADRQCATPDNGPSKTGNRSGKGSGNNPPKNKNF